MFQELNEQIVKVKGDIRRKQKLESQLTDYKNELHEIEATISQLSNQLNKEQKDVKKLEGVSITNLISTIIGTKYEKLDQEEQEVAAVQLKLEEARKTEQEIVESIEEIDKKLQLLRYSNTAYNQLLKKKEEMIKDNHSSYSEHLYQLDEREADTKAYVTELNEAIVAGNHVENALDQAIDSLQSAKGWGTWDMVGGGMLSSAMKLSHIDDATSHIHIAQTKMRRFQKELVDVNETASMDVDMSGLLKFADFFFDGFIVDWVVQGRIQDSLAQTQEQLSNVKGIITKLNEQMKKENHTLSRIKMERDKLIASV
ncbi:hypothetical protein SAMN05216389_109162 [Oceanobacillus limi]|uniref:Uncharacterized protein n=1 Tax=Oceanobacillus limi TaxID=930131 RepID=A0A1I0DTQ1_9BACI|nr:hypothetical protein [Oceanobacillus limi]SET35995.1 hypothetical protein SAMN05216389_109162 [Oceanobacillus limi]